MKLNKSKSYVKWLIVLRCCACSHSLHLSLSLFSLSLSISAALFYDFTLLVRMAKVRFRCDLKRNSWKIYHTCETRWEWKEHIHKASTMSKIHITFVVSHAGIFLFCTFQSRKRLINKITIWVRILIDTNLVNTLFHFIFSTFIKKRNSK